MTALADITDRFADVVGVRRGDPWMPLLTLADPAEQFAGSYARLGLKASLERLSPDLKKLAANTRQTAYGDHLPDELRPLQAAVAQAVQGLADALVSDVAAARAPWLAFWAKTVAVRPHWCQFLYGTSDDLRIHFCPDGDSFADTEDTMRGIAFACGKSADGATLLNRGSWARALTSQNPAMSKPCPECAAAANGHPETLAEDETCPLPLPAWQEAVASVVDVTRTKLYETDDADELLAHAQSYLDSGVASWAAERYAKQPRAHILRALRSNGAVPGAHSDSALLGEAETLAARIPRVWFEWQGRMLDHQRSDEPTSKTWAQALRSLGT